MKANTFNKVFLGLVFFLVLFYSFWLGIDVQRGDTKEIIVDAVLLAFWLFALVFFNVMNKSSEKLDRELEESTKNLDKAMGDFLGHMKKEAEEHRSIQKGLHEATKSITGGDRPAKPSEFKKVEAKFHELTGKHLKLTAVKGDKRPGAEVSDEPFAATKKAPVKKQPVAPKKGATNVKARR